MGILKKLFLITFAVVLLFVCWIISANAYTTEIKYVNCDYDGGAFVFSKKSCAIKTDDGFINCSTGLGNMMHLDPACVDYIVDFKLKTVIEKLDYNNCIITFNTISELPNGVEKYKALIETCGEMP